MDSLVNAYLLIGGALGLLIAGAVAQRDRANGRRWPDVATRFGILAGIYVLAWPLMLWKGWQT